MNVSRLTRCLCVLLFTLFTLMLSPTTFAHTVPKKAGQITEYSLPKNSDPQGITTGSDGNLWFTEYIRGKIGRITPQGTITEYRVNACCPSDITSGPNGDLWYTVGDDNGKLNASYIGKITLQGKSTLYPLFSQDRRVPFSITVGPDGNLWFTIYQLNSHDLGDGVIGQMTPSGKITLIQLGANSIPLDITAGPDGNLWFTESDKSFIGLVQLNPSTLKLKKYPMPNGDPLSITTGPDGNLWLTDFTPGKIAEFNLSTSKFSTHAIPTPNSRPWGITTGPDGNLWFTESGGNKIGRISPVSHAITEFPIPSPNSFPTQITPGPDGNVWFVESIIGASKIGKITTG
ncbi:MAG: Virginiamycin B lyase [Ktedonobacteraceae bacterium]